MVNTQGRNRSEEHTSELQSQSNLVCRLLLEKKQESRQIPALMRTPPPCRLCGAAVVAVEPPLGPARCACSSAAFIVVRLVFLFFFNDTATTEIYTLSLHDALPISSIARMRASSTASARESSPMPGA